MKIKEIRLENVKIYNENNEELYSGEIENAPSSLLDLDIKSLAFDSSILIIHAYEHN